MFDTLELNNPIVFGLIGGLVIYIILLLKKKKNNNKEIIKAKLANTKPNINKVNISLKLPIIVGIMMWGATNYFSLNNNDGTKTSPVYGGSTKPVFDQEIYTDRANF